MFVLMRAQNFVYTDVEGFFIFRITPSKHLPDHAKRWREPPECRSVELGYPALEKE